MTARQVDLKAFLLDHYWTLGDLSDAIERATGHRISRPTLCRIVNRAYRGASARNRHAIETFLATHDVHSCASCIRRTAAKVARRPRIASAEGARS